MAWSVFKFAKVASLTFRPSFIGRGYDVDSSGSIDKVNSLLEDLIEYFDENSIQFLTPDMKNSNLIDRILSELENAETTYYEQIFLQSKKEFRKLMLFIELLPYVGTHSSAIFIRDLIRANTIQNENTIQRILANLPEFLKCPSEKLLFELEDMLHFEASNETIPKAALLSYSYLIRRTFMDSNKNSILLEKYITKFIEKYQQADDPQQKVLYLECLGNIGIGSVPTRLIHLLYEESNEILRSTILRVITSTGHQDENVVIKNVWSILSNESMDLQLRLIAYQAFVNIKEPSMKHFMKLFRFMETEPNELLYSFHFSTMKSFAENPEFNDHTRALAEVAKVILGLSRKPFTQFKEGLFIAQSFDPIGNNAVRLEILFGTKSMGLKFSRMHRNIETSASVFAFVDQRKYKFF